MNKELFAQLLLQAGTTGLPLLAKLMSDYTAGRSNTTVTPEDVLELHRLKEQKGEDIYAKLGIKLPPVVPPTQEAAATPAV